MHMCDLACTHKGTGGDEDVEDSLSAETAHSVEGPQIADASQATYGNTGRNESKICFQRAFERNSTVKQHLKPVYNNKERQKDAYTY